MVFPPGHEIPYSFDISFTKSRQLEMRIPFEAAKRVAPLNPLGSDTWPIDRMIEPAAGLKSRRGWVPAACRTWKGSWLPDLQRKANTVR